VDRDRDEQGRPRNARPRDALGRPLPRGETGSAPVPEEPLPPDQTLVLAQQLLDEGRPFHAHEVLEAAWKNAPGSERDLWQGLAQLAVGLTHALRGNRAGAGALLTRGAGRIRPYADQPRLYNIDVSGLVAWAHDTVSQLGTGDEPPGAPRLTRE